jgi:RNA polymerase sigma-70 factor (ECF subfamily)
MAVAAVDRRMLGLRRDRAEREFEQMYRRHAGDVFRYSLLVLRSRPDAEDVTQATFVRAYRAMQRGEAVRKPQNWLIKIAHNECRRYLRTVSRRAVEVELDPAITEAPDADGPSAEEIRQALSHLSFNQRAALVMRELEDRSYAEIADVLDVSVSAVETLLFRARRALREQMEGPVACGEVEGLLLLQMDGTLGADDQRRLRVHTRACSECATLERRHRGRRAALKRLGSGITLPPSLSSFFGSGGSVAGGAAAGIGAKIAAVAIATVTAASVGVVQSKRASGSGSTASGPEVLVGAAPAAAQVSSSSSAVGRLHAAAVRSAAAQRPRTGLTLGASSKGLGPHVAPKSRRNSAGPDGSAPGVGSAASAAAGNSAGVVATSASAANAPAAVSVRGGTTTVRTTVRSQVRNATQTLPGTVKEGKKTVDTVVKTADDTVKQTVGTVAQTADDTVAKTGGTVNQTVGTVTKTVDGTVGAVVATAPVPPPVTIAVPAVQLPVPPLPTPKPVLPALPSTPPLPVVPAVPTPVPVALPAAPAPPQPPALPVPKK